VAEGRGDALLVQNMARRHNILLGLLDIHCATTFFGLVSKCIRQTTVNVHPIPLASRKLTELSFVRYVEAMLMQTWRTSKRKYREREKRDFSIPTRNGTEPNSYLYRSEIKTCTTPSNGWGHIWVQPEDITA
jgi:hypothetical protein